jgi:hypothetical protein
MKKGWKCPGCGRCYSPKTDQCSYCIGVDASRVNLIYGKITLPDGRTISIDPEYPKIEDARSGFGSGRYLTEINNAKMNWAGYSEEKT